MSEWPLDGTETLLWQGQPRTDFHFGLGGLVGLGFAGIIWMVGVSLIVLFGDALGRAALPVGIGSAVLGAGAIVMFPLLDQAARRKTRYALTTRRAFVWTTQKSNLSARDLAGWPINAPGDLVYHPGQPGSIFFGFRANLPDQGAQHPRSGFAVGFDRIDEAETVWRLISDVAAQNVKS